MKINIKVVEASYNVCTSGLVHKLDPIDDWSGCMAFSLSSTEPGHVPAIHSGNSTFFHEEAEKISMGVEMSWVGFVDVPGGLGRPFKLLAGEGTGPGPQNKENGWDPFRRVLHD